jgi:hypothetical protein
MRVANRVSALAGVALLAGAPFAASGGEAAAGYDLSYAAPALPPPADTGKPALSLPPAMLAPDPKGCVPALPCGSRLVGEIRKDGAVMLQVPALRW